MLRARFLHNNMPGVCGPMIKAATRCPHCPAPGQMTVIGQFHENGPQNTKKLTFVIIM